MMLQLNSNVDGTKSEDMQIEEHRKSCTIQTVSDIILQIIEDLPNFRCTFSADENICVKKEKRNIEICEAVSSNVTDIKQTEDGSVLSCIKQKQKEGVTKSNIPVKTTSSSYLKNGNSDSVNNMQGEIDEGVLKNCDKEMLLSALHLSPVSGNTSKEFNIQERNVAEKKKENVYFNSPIAVVYEFSEKSEAVSDDNTDILSDSDSVDFPLSQTKYTDNLELQDKATNLKTIDSEQDISRLLVSNETNFKECMNNCIMTSRGDCFNIRMSENFNVTLQQSDETVAFASRGSMSVNNQSNLSPNCDSSKIMLTGDNERCIIVKTEESAEHLLKHNIENDANDNGKTPCSPAADGYIFTLHDETPENIILDKDETKESHAQTSGKKYQSEKQFLGRENYMIKNCDEDENGNTVFRQKSGDLSYLDDGGGKIDSLLRLDYMCQTEDSDVIEIFTKLPLIQKRDNIDSSQDLFINCSDRQKISHKVGIIDKSERNSVKESSSCDCKESVNETNIGSNKCQQGTIQAYSVSETDKSDEYVSTVNECESHKIMIQNSQRNENKNSVNIENYSDEISETTETVLSQVGKREQSSPEIHCSHISKKSKSDIEGNSETKFRKRKIFKEGPGENRTVKLPRLDSDLSKSDDKKVPKLLKQLASDVIVTLDENVIWDSTKVHTEHTEKWQNFEENISSPYCIHESRLSSTEDVSKGCLNSVAVDSEIVNFVMEIEEEIVENKSVFNQHAEVLKQLDLGSEPENDLNESQINTSEHINCTPETRVSHIEMPEACDMTEEDFPNGQSLPKSPGFISATELLSQSSQESGSTGFTVNAGDPFSSQYVCRKNSFDNFEERQIETVEDLLKENNKCRIVENLEQEPELADVTTHTFKSRSIVEITEDGLKEEKLDDADICLVSCNDVNRNIKLDDSHICRAATDQDEQIDTDQLDMYVDRAVDQIVPDECAKIAGETGDTDRLQTLYVKDEDQKPKIYSCDLDLCDEKDDLLCNVLNKSGKSYGKCFNWKYRPSCDLENDVHLPELPDEDHVVTITRLKTCGKPLRLGLSKRQPVKNSLHKFGIKK